jgi:DNA-binding HxlR family transcriptional regulator
VQKTDLSAARCPIARTLSVVGDWWSLLIVRDALNGLRRFGEFQRHLGCARNILSARLAKLVEHGVLRIVPAADGSAYHEYEPTERGRELRLVLEAMRQWGERNLFEPGEELIGLVDNDSGDFVAPLRLHAADGRPLTNDEVHTHPRLRA